LPGPGKTDRVLPAFLTTLLFAVSGVSANRTTRLLGGVEANFWRISLAMLLLALWAHTFGSGIAGKAFLCFLLSGCMGFGLGDLALYQTLPRLGSRLSILLVHCLAAPVAALIEWLWLGTTLNTLQIVCSLTILAGVALALAPGRQAPIPKPLLISGVLFGITAAVGQGSGAVVSRKAYQMASAAGEHIDGLTAAYQRIMAGWVLAAVTFGLMRKRLARLGLQPKPWTLVWKWILVNALAGPTLGVGCYQWALSTQPTGIVLPIVAITPIVIIPLAHVTEGERPTKRSLAGGAIAVGGAFLLAGGGKLLLRLIFG
jgi:drug/metabolite transporter (DMT)-like permease